MILLQSNKTGLAYFNLSLHFPGSIHQSRKRANSRLILKDLVNRYRFATYYDEINDGRSFESPSARLAVSPSHNYLVGNRTEIIQIGSILD